MAKVFESLCPVLVVDEVEPCAKFWHKLGFETVHSVAHDDKIGWIMLGRDGVMVQYQSRASIKKDIPGLKFGKPETSPGHYVSVSDLKAVLKLLGRTKAALPKRKTFYGATEAFYRDPAGYLFVFAQHG